MTTELPWYSDHRNLACLAKQLIDEHGPAFDVVRFLEKPRKWTPEWNELAASLATVEVTLTDRLPSPIPADTVVMSSSELREIARDAMEFVDVGGEG